MKIKKILLCVMVFAISIFALSACSCTEIFTTTYKLEFTVQGKSYHKIDPLTQKVSDVANPNIEGYKFEGWFLDKNYTEPFIMEDYEGKELTKNVKVYAKLIDITIYYNVDFVLDGEIIKTITVQNGSTLNANQYPSLPQRDGMDGFWQVDDNCVVYSNKTINAIYKKYYYINFDVVNADGSTIDPIKAYYNDPIKSLPIATKNNYIFDGWYYEDNKIEESDLYSYESNITVEARFTPMPSKCVIFYSQNEIYASLNPIVDDLLGLTTPEVDGYRFGGWYLDEKYNNAFIASDYIDVILDEEINVYAKLDALHKVYYEVDGEIISSTEVCCYDYLTNVPVPSKTDYIFKGWYYNNRLFKEGSKFYYREDITLIAKFEIITYLVIFVTDEGYVERTYPIHTNLYEASIPEVSQRAGYIGHWDNLVDDLTENVKIIVPEYIPIDITVNFYNGDELILSKIVTYDEYFGEIPTLEDVDGYRCVGWFEGENKITYNTRCKYTETVNLIAKFKKIYRIYYDYNGAEFEYQEYNEVMFGEPVPPMPNIIEKFGYEFSGWKYGDDRISNGILYNYEHDVTVVAQWTSKLDPNVECGICGVNEFEIDGVTYCFIVDEEIKELKLNKPLRNSTTEFDFNGTLNFSENTMWRLYSSYDYEPDYNLPDKICHPYEGERHYYIRVVPLDNPGFSVYLPHSDYKVTIYRNTTYTVNFYNLTKRITDSPFTNVKVEEGYSLLYSLNAKDSTIVDNDDVNSYFKLQNIDEYYHAGWVDNENSKAFFDFNTPITSNISLYAYYDTDEEYSRFITTGIMDDKMFANLNESIYEQIKDTEINIILPKISGTRIVERLGFYAFSNFTINSIFLPETINYSNYNSFYNSKINYIYVRDANTWKNLRFYNINSNPVNAGAQVWVVDENGEPIERIA